MDLASPQPSPQVILESGADGNTVSAYSAAARKLVLITTKYVSSGTVTYNLSNFASVQGPIVRWATLTSGKGDTYARYTDVSLEGACFAAHFEADMVQTFEVSNVRRK